MSTVVALHAHPDDEVLLTGGTLALAARRGDRVVLVTATAGEAGLSDTAGDLRATRLAELQDAAGILGCAEVVVLDHVDSGMSGDRPGGYAHRPVTELGAELRDLLVEQRADVLLGYDPRGGYGHPDHRQVHRVARWAAATLPRLQLAEATVDRDALARGLRWVRRLPFVTPSWDDTELADAFTPAGEITHRVDVRSAARVKRAAMRAHRSQTSGGEGDRTLAVLGALPLPLFRRVLGTEWFTQIVPAH